MEMAFLMGMILTSIIDGILNVNDDDIDNDGNPNANDPDIDNDGIPNQNDPDLDNDGVPNVDDADDDNDGINDDDEDLTITIPHPSTGTPTEQTF